MNLKDNLKKIRKDNNLSQEDLAEKLGVSRQAVSKWEQGLAYPEMDKVLQLCNMFNLNIDEILNQDIKEVEKNRQSKINVNKYIDDFLEYIKKTVKMFASMKISDKLKCIIEELFIVFVLFVVSQLVGAVLGLVCEKLLGFLSGSTYYTIYEFLEGIYYLIYFILSVIVILYIFKIRYLDYYEIVESDEVKEESSETKEEVITRKNLTDKREKVIIRDPKHSEYGFINAIIKCLLFIIKGVLFFFGIFVCMSLVAMVMLLVISFNFIKTGLLFIGGLLGCLSLIIIHLIIIYLIFSFISNLKVKKVLTFCIFMTCIILGGVSCGLIVNSLKDFKFVSDVNSDYIKTTTKEIEMNKNLIIDTYYDIEYKESNNKNLLIEVKTAKYCNYNIDEEENHLYFYHDCDADEFIKTISKDLNNKVFVDPNIEKITIYTTKDNIKLLQDNYEKFNKSIQDNENQRLYEEIDRLNSELYETKMKLNECEEG